MGQLGQDQTATATVRAALLARVGRETDPAPLGALGRSLGRLPGPIPIEVQAALVDLAGRPGPPSLRLDAARALEAMVRGLVGASPAAPAPFPPEVVARLRALATYGDPPAEVAAKIRRAAVTALVRIDRGNIPAIAAALGDADPQVRRLGVIWAGDSVTIEGQRAMLERALGDPSPMVRLEALRAWARRFRAGDCEPIIRAVRDPVLRVGLVAIDLLGGPCPPAADPGAVLWPLVDSLAGSQRGSIGTIASWHRGAHALVSLARASPNRVRGVLSRAGTDLTWQVRMYAARAAGIIGDGDRLLEMVEDRNDNVREAAIGGLLRLRGHAADSIFRLQLARPDYQLVQTAAAALEGTPDKARAAAALMIALRRITAERKETSRDPRVAILRRLAEVGAAAQAAELEGYLTDFDSEVADLAAQLVSRWTGHARVARPARLSSPPLSWTAIRRLQGARLRFTMSPAAGAGIFEVALDPDVAPATVARIVANARARYYDGLTFHRVEPNFVIQGGSPGANEYAGDALYLRDEIGAGSHERGSLGISTRGRDTGDAQIFVNLVDNLRLDFNYTVWGRVMRGMEVVESIVEGDEMERVVVVGAGKRE
jgi:cyclophilin family peptidyl-prolyl cis-trans isomerase/HEAT repeat protein